LAIRDIAVISGACIDDRTLKPTTTGTHLHEFQFHFFSGDELIIQGLLMMYFTTPAIAAIHWKSGVEGC
jgi:hypothetical protein